MPSALGRCGLLQRCLDRLGRVTLPLEGGRIQRMPCQVIVPCGEMLGPGGKFHLLISLWSVDPEARADGDAADAASAAAAADVGDGPWDGLQRRGLT